MSQPPEKPTRVLLVSPRAEEVKTLGGPLARERISVGLAKSLTAAIDALQKQAFDALVLSLPVPEAEGIGACAALAADAGCPPIVLLDAVDRSREVLGALPADARPARCLVAPVDGAKLAHVVREVIEREGEEGASVERRGLASALLDLARRAETGALEVRGDGVTTRIYFRAGAAVSVEGGRLRESLGRMLVRSGRLEERDYERVIRRMTEQLIDNEHQRMGEVLIELGLMTASEVYEALSGQAVEKIVACFSAARSELAFDEMPALPDGLEPLAVPPVRALLLDAVRQHFSESELKALLAPHLGARLALRESPAELRLAGEDARAVAALSGARSVADILRAQPKARPLLAALVLIDAVGAVAAAATPVAKIQLTSIPVPRAEAKHAREVVGARRPLAGPGAAASPPRATAKDDTKARLEAEQLFQQARKLLEREKFQEATTLLQKVVALQPTEPEYRMIDAWAAYLAARVAQRVARAKAIACARKVIESDPRAGKPHAILGRLLLEDGDAKGAAREFELALMRDSSDEDAKKGLAQARGGK